MIRWLAFGCLCAGCVTVRPAPQPAPEPSPVVEPLVKPDLEAEARRVIERFVNATEAGQFLDAHALLSAPLRARYTPELLGRDYSADPLGRERVALIKGKRTAPLSISGERATLQWAPGRLLRLTREGGSWTIAALE